MESAASARAKGILNNKWQDSVTYVLTTPPAVNPQFSILHPLYPQASHPCPSVPIRGYSPVRVSLSRPPCLTFHNGQLFL